MPDAPANGVCVNTTLDALSVRDVAGKLGAWLHGYTHTLGWITVDGVLHVTRLRGTHGAETLRRTASMVVALRYATGRDSMPANFRALLDPGTGAGVRSEK